MRSRKLAKSFDQSSVAFRLFDGWVQRNAKVKFTIKVKLVRWLGQTSSEKSPTLVVIRWVSESQVAQRPLPFVSDWCLHLVASFDRRKSRQLSNRSIPYWFWCALRPYPPRADAVEWIKPIKLPTKAKVPYCPAQSNMVTAAYILVYRPFRDSGQHQKRLHYRAQLVNRTNCRHSNRNAPLGLISCGTANCPSVNSSFM